MAGAGVRAATEKLRKQATGDYGLGRNYEAPSPAAAMYGVFAPQYAAALAAPTPSAAEQALREMALRNNAEEEARRYEEQLAAAQANQLQGEHIRGGYGLQEALIGQMPEGALHGQYGVFTDPNTGATTVRQDPILQAGANDLLINESVAGSREKNASAIGKLAEAGIRTPVETASGYMTHPFQTKADTFGVWNDQQFTPDQEIKEYEADEGMTVEEQFQFQREKIDAAIEQARLNGDKITEMYGTDGTFLGTRIERKGANQTPPGTPPPMPGNPKAGAQSGGAPATKAAPVPDAKVITAQLFPGIKINEHRRDPNSPLGKANPDSWHNKSGAAVDVKPVKGMTFEQFVDRYKKAGYQIIEQRDEVKNPSKHATGPHWHVVLGQNKNVQTAQGNPSRVNNLQVIAKRARDAGGKVTWNNGTLVVTAPDGRTKSYGP